MSRLFFRPFLGLTLFTVISIAILISLGTWQYHRLQWKTELLSQVEQAVTAPPLRSVDEISHALSKNTPVDFRRVEFSAEAISGQQPYLVYSRQKRALMWRKYVVLKDSQSGRAFYAATGFVPDAQRDGPIDIDSAPQSYAGYVRLWRAPERGAVVSSPEKNRWFGFDPLRETAPWSTGQKGEFTARPIETRFYIDVAGGETTADTLPIKRPEIRNNHFDYMLTWYGLALTLFVIYIILHRQRGRLGFKRGR